MKVAIIGNGFISENHRAAIRDLREDGVDVELVAVCDVREEMLEKNDGARTYTDADELLKNEKELDFVCICLPTYLHKEYTVKFLMAGVNVLCEKPMALNYKDCLEMIEAEKKSGKRLMVAHCVRFAAPLVAIYNFIKSGKFGKPRSAFFTSTGGQPRWGFENWFANGELSGGAMLDLQAHNVDLMNRYFGVPEYASSVGGACAPDFTGYGSTFGNWVYKDGLTVSSWCDWSVPKNKHHARSVRINFEGGYLYNERGARNELVAVDNDGNVTDITDPKLSTKSTHYLEIKYFMECLESGAAFDYCPLTDSAENVRIITAQRESIKQCGAPVRIEDVKE